MLQRAEQPPYGLETQPQPQPQEHNGLPPHDRASGELGKVTLQLQVRPRSRGQPATGDPKLDLVAPV